MWSIFYAAEYYMYTSESDTDTVECVGNFNVHIYADETHFENHMNICRNVVFGGVVMGAVMKWIWFPFSYNNAVFILASLSRNAFSIWNYFKTNSHKTIFHYCTSFEQLSVFVLFCDKSSNVFQAALATRASSTSSLRIPFLAVCSECRESDETVDFSLCLCLTACSLIQHTWTVLSVTSWYRWGSGAAPSCFALCIAAIIAPFCIAAAPGALEALRHSGGAASCRRLIPYDLADCGSLAHYSWGISTVFFIIWLYACIFTLI